MSRTKLTGSLCLPLVVLLAAGQAVASESYTWTPIVIPNVAISGAFGPNDLGQIAIVDVTGTVSGIYQNGRFTRLPAPPQGYQVGAYGINDAGTIAGYATTTLDAHLQGFVLQHGRYRFFSQSGWQNTAARAIGPSGLVVGISYQDDQSAYAGFVYDPSSGTFTDVTPPGSVYTIAQGINRFGRVSGSGQDGIAGRYAFVRQQSASPDGALQPFLERTNIADGVANARGINDEDVITGWMRSSSGVTSGFVGSAVRGYQVLMPPGGDASGAMSYCQGINNARQVACIITDVNGNTLAAFLGTPSGNEQ